MDVRALHPPLAQIWVLWHVYVENIDPLLKIFHAPSFHKQLLQAVQDLGIIDNEVETLLFAVYYAATVSLLRVEECSEELKESRRRLLER
jgi:hypothetical protein